ncbi:MAG: VCBS repeat-containing protein [Proteobacteria bacterium]|nr:VCBS repeat-containing protein [Pseudomonadota bacterium]
MLPVPIDLPPQLHGVSIGDIDGDGREELVLVERLPVEGEPDAVRLTVVHFSPEGRIEARKKIDLGNVAVRFDAREGALWIHGPSGVTRNGESVLGAGLDRMDGTPVRTKLVRDLGRGPWLVVEAEGRLWARTPAGDDRGSIESPSTIVLGRESSQGGVGLETTVRGPTTAWADLDGDGLIDVLRPSGTTLFWHRTTAQGLGATATEWELPYELFSRNEDAGEGFESITDVHFRDLDGDGRDDLLVHRIVSEGGFFGSTSEVEWHRNTGSGFETMQTLELETGSAESFPRDVDGDGDLDLLVPSVDISFANAAQALLSRSFTIKLLKFPMDGDAYGSPTVLREVRVSLEDFDVAWEMEADFDGDGIDDAVLSEGGNITIARSDLNGFGTLEEWTVQNGVEELTIGDVTGDGRPEVFGWAKGEERGTLLVLQ